MPRERILVVDDDEDIRDVLKLTLEEENYEVLEAKDGKEALEVIKKLTPHIVILDYKMPKKNGAEVCEVLRKDIALRHLPIIMLTGKSETQDKVEGLEAGADDYIIKPFEPKELLARIRMVLKRSMRDLDANPLTRLPGNVSILNELQSRLQRKQDFSVCYVDLDKFKSYNDKYGFKNGDNVIQETAKILINSALSKGNIEDFVGHIGGDDFVVITTQDKVDEICKKIIADFDKLAPLFYNEADKSKGYILTKNRKGEEQKFSFLSISIAVVVDAKKLDHVGRIGEVGAELKTLAKKKDKSNYVKDLRN